MLTINQISVFVENKPGKLSKITGILSAENIDIRALSIADTTDFGILRLIVNDHEKALQVLRSNDITVSLTAVIAVKMSDKPGSLHEILEILKNENIAVEYAYAFITRGGSDAFVILRVENNERAADVLAKNKISLLSQAEVSGV